MRSGSKYLESSSRLRLRLERAIAESSVHLSSTTLQDFLGDEKNDIISELKEHIGRFQWRSFSSTWRVMRKRKKVELTEMLREAAKAAKVRSAVAVAARIPCASSEIAPIGACSANFFHCWPSLSAVPAAAQCPSPPSEHAPLFESIFVKGTSWDAETTHRLDALASMVEKCYHEMKNDMTKINGGRLMAICNGQKMGDQPSSSLYRSLKDKYSPQTRDEYFSPDELGDKVLETMRKENPRLESYSLGKVRLLAFERGPGQVVHMDVEAPKGGSGELVGTVLLTAGAPGTTYWEIKDAPATVTTKALRKIWSDAPEELFDCIDENETASELLRKWGHLLWASEGDSVEVGVAERFSTRIIHACQPHCAPSTVHLPKGSIRLVLFFTLVPPGFEGNSNADCDENNEDQQMSKDRLPWALYDALGVGEIPKAVDEYLLSKFMDFALASAEEGKRDNHQTWGDALSQKWKKMWKENMEKLVRTGKGKRTAEIAASRAKKKFIADIEKYESIEQKQS